MMINKEKLIKGMSLEDLSCLCQDLGHANYRGEQIFDWLYKHRKDGFNETSNLPLDLVDKLKLPVCHLLNSSVYDHGLEIIKRIRKRKDEIVGHGRTNAESQGEL